MTAEDILFGGIVGLAGFGAMAYVFGPALVLVAFNLGLFLGEVSCG